MYSLPLSVVLLAASTALSAQTFTVLYNFQSNRPPRHPMNPGIIAQSRGGAMLSTSSDAGNGGTAWRIWPNGSLTVLGEFLANDGGLTLATDGRYYGTTKYSGASGHGSVYKVTQDGIVTTLHSFTGGADGANPCAPPIQSVRGDFYGTTSAGGSLGYGTVYRITKYGTFTLLHTFNGSDGADSEAPLVQGTDFYFYGTTVSGGSGAGGTIFRVNRSGDLKTLVNFNGTNGSNPYAGLIQANDGNFYGVASNGGSASDALGLGGVLFRMTPQGTLTILHNFTDHEDGAVPMGGLVQASDGNLYGTNLFGVYGSGSQLFRASLTGAILPLHELCDPRSSLLQHTNGIIYGDDNQCGTEDSSGYFYSYDADLPPFVTYLPTYGRAGALVQILGQGFTSGSQVFFNGTPAASPSVVYPTYIRVAVPSGATTGPITVTTMAGTLSSNKVFIVHPN